MADAYGSERLTTKNTVAVPAKVGTYATRTIYVHEDDMPLEEDKHIRFIGWTVREPTEFGFYPTYGLVDEIRGSSIPIYFISLDGFGSRVEALND